ncbi:glycosyl transferase family protein [Aeromonas caviae]|nr:glycosyl transferase family protein [Aeromonas caviae]
MHNGEQMLEICISTYGKRINRLSSLPFLNNCRYLIVHQDYVDVFISNDAKERFSYEDITLIESDTKGLTNSRNEALKYSTEELILISDDDVVYECDVADKILSAQKENPFHIALFKAKVTEDSTDFRKYPINSGQLSKIECLHACSIEMVIDKRKIDTSEVFFNKDFGIGAKFICGEESVFLFDAIDANLNVSFINQYIVSHPKESTATNKNNAFSILKAKGAVYRYGFGFIIGLLLILRLSFLKPMSKVMGVSKFYFLKSLLTGFMAISDTSQDK